MSATERRARGALVARSSLYVPADRPRLLEGALRRQADAVVVDLEDGVAPAGRRGARRALVEWLDAVPLDEPTPIWVRIGATAVDSVPTEDLDVAVHPMVAGVVQAKAHSKETLERLDEELGQREVSAGIHSGTLAVAVLVESAQAVLRMEALACAPRVVRLQLGEADLTASLGMTPGPEGAELLPIRLAAVVVSAAAGLLPPMGPVERALDDHEGLLRSSVALRGLGFGGRSAVHPVQVPIINRAFTPSVEEVETARRIIAAAGDASVAGGVVVGEDGRMVDEAVVRGARAVVQLAEAIAARAGRAEGAGLR